MLTIFANYVMGSPMSPGFEFDFTVLEECRETTFIALQDAQKKKVSLKMWLSVSIFKTTYFHNLLCRRTKTGGPAVISGTMAGSYFCYMIFPAGDTRHFARVIQELISSKNYC